MNKKTISVIGGYGATGEVVVKKLAAETDHAVLIVGRDEYKARELARKTGRNTRAAGVDLFDDTQLNKLCAESSIVVNCAGPSAKIKDRIARAALHNQCDYIDAGGYEFTYDLLKQDDAYVKAKGLCCVLSAGWIPGIAEVLAHHADLLAGDSFDAKEHMTVYYGDRNTWTDPALLDTIQYIKKNGVRNMVIVKAGEPKIQMNPSFTQTVDLPFGVGKQRGFLHLVPELKPFALSHREYKTVKSYLVLFGWRTYLAMIRIKFLLTSEKACIKALRNAYRHELTKGSLGVAIAEITGKKNGQTKRFQVGFANDGGYELTGLGCAATVMQLLEKKIKPGVNYLPEAVQAAEFMKTLSSWGMKTSYNTTFL